MELGALLAMLGLGVLAASAGFGGGSSDDADPTVVRGGADPEPDETEPAPTVPTELIFGDEDDTVAGTSADERIFTLGGDDLVNAGGGDDFVDAGTGDDTANGGPGDDTIDLGAGDDQSRDETGDSGNFILHPQSLRTQQSVFHQ